jgi:hypothetical protein
MKIKKIIALLLLMAVTCLILLTACGDDAVNDGGNVENNQNAQEGETPDISDEPQKSITEIVFEKLPKADYDGYAFRAVTAPSTWSEFLERMITSEETGDIVFDAVYYRNLVVEDHFNVKIEPIVREAGAITGFVRNSIMAGDDAFDLVLHWTHEMGAMPFNEFFIDLRNQPHIDISQPWYPAKTNNAMMVNGKQYFVHSEMTMNTSALAYTNFYNLAMAQEYGLPDVHPIVLEGKWTFDVMMEHIKGVSRDLNGDGEMRIQDDRFGYGITVNPPEGLLSLQYGMGQFTASVDSTGQPQLAFDAGRMTAIVDKLNYLFYVSGEGIATPVAWDTAIVAFREGRLLMVNCVMMMADRRFRDMEDPYTVLPMPKFDEAQQNYYTTMPSGASTVINSIPITVGNVERSTVIFEALSAIGYEKIRPAFFEVALKTKYARDDITSQMFDIVMDSNMIDFGFIYDGSARVRDVMYRSVTSNNNTVVSDFDAIQERAAAHYETIMERYN